MEGFVCIFVCVFAFMHSVLGSLETGSEVETCPQSFLQKMLLSCNIAVAGALADGVCGEQGRLWEQGEMLWSRMGH